MSTESHTKPTLKHIPTIITVILAISFLILTLVSAHIPESALTSVLNVRVATPILLLQASGLAVLSILGCSLLYISRRYKDYDSLNNNYYIAGTCCCVMGLVFAGILTTQTAANTVDAKARLSNLATILDTKFEVDFRYAITLSTPRVVKEEGTLLGTTYVTYQPVTSVQLSFNEAKRLEAFLKNTNSLAYKQLEKATSLASNN